MNDLAGKSRDIRMDLDLEGLRENFGLRLALEEDRRPERGNLLEEEYEKEVPEILPDEDDMALNEVPKGQRRGHNLESQNLAGIIDRANSLQALQEVVANNKFYVDGELYPGWQAIQVFMEAKKYLKENMEAIIAGTINGGNTEYRNGLGDRIRAISEINPQLGEKTRELMKGLMKNWFEKRQASLATRAVTDSCNIQQLANAVYQFKYINENGVNLEKERLCALFGHCVAEVRRLYVSSRISKNEVEQILEKYRMPLAHGIREKAVELFLQEANDYRAISRQGFIGGSSSGSADSSTKKGQGIWGKVKGFFSRK